MVICTPIEIHVNGRTLQKRPVSEGMRFSFQLENRDSNTDEEKQPALLSFIYDLPATGKMSSLFPRFFVPFRTFSPPKKKGKSGLKKSSFFATKLQTKNPRTKSSFKPIT